MLFEIYCGSCGDWILRGDSEKLGFPFTPGMFTIPYDSPYGRMWSLAGRIDFDLQCPECLSFPLGHRDGQITPFLRVKIDEDKRFSAFKSLDDIKAWVAVEEAKIDFQKRVEHASQVPPSTIPNATMNPEKKARLSLLLDNLKENPTGAFKKNVRERSQYKERTKRS